MRSNLPCLVGIVGVGAYDFRNGGSVEKLEEGIETSISRV